MFIRIHCSQDNKVNLNECERTKINQRKVSDKGAEQEINNRISGKIQNVFK